MDITQADTIDGNESSRQIMITLTHICVLFGGFMMIGIFQAILLEIAGSNGLMYLTSGAFIPLTFLIWVLLAWWYIPKGYINPRANRIQATDNIWDREYFEDGSTCFIVYQTGFALKYAWERLHGKEVEIEMEKALDCEKFTITIQDIALEVKIQGMYRIWVPRLSAFLQNIENQSATILKQLQAELNQEIEAYASTFESTDHVRKHQNTIIRYVLGQVQETYRDYGINLVKLNFARCDYSTETQKELNKLLELKGIEKVATGIQDQEKFRLAAAAAGKPGIKVSKEIKEIVMSPATAEALSKMSLGGAIALGLNQEGGGH